MIYQKTYLDIIKQQQQKPVQAKPVITPVQKSKEPKKFLNLLKRVKYDDSDNIKAPNYKFGGQRLKYSNYSSEETLEDYVIPDDFLEDIQLTNECSPYSIYVNGPIEIQYSFQPYEPRTWDYPGCDACVDDIGDISFPFSFDLNDKKNNEILQIEIYHKDTDEIEKVQFTELPVKDKKIILHSIVEYFESQKFYQQFNELILNKEDNYDGYDDYDY